jgi:hypothetical protein
MNAAKQTGPFQFWLERLVLLLLGVALIVLTVHLETMEQKQHNATWITFSLLAAYSINLILTTVTRVLSRNRRLAMLLGMSWLAVALIMSILALKGIVGIGWSNLCTAAFGMNMWSPARNG